jgi:hypothetical protein
VAGLALAASVTSGCTDLLETPRFQPRDASARLDAVTIDGTHEAGAADGARLDGVNGDTHEEVDAGVPDAFDAHALEGGRIEAGTSDVPRTDATPDLVAATDGETTLDAGTAIYAGPAGGSCATADFHPDANFNGTTCGGTDSIALACNPGAHPDVAIRIDARAGDVFTLSISAGLSYGMFLGTACDLAPLACAGVTTGAGSITLGPYPTARVDYVVIESADAGGCGAYTAMLHRL